MNRVAHILMRGIRRAIIDPREALLISRMAAWVCILSALVRLRPLPSALKIVAGKPRQTQASLDAPQKLARAIDLLLNTNVFVFKPNCWKRSAILHRYLALNGIATRIVFGVRPDVAGGIDGHAWLEADGEPILETATPNYKITYTFPSSEAFDLNTASLPPA